MISPTTVNPNNELNEIFGTSTFYYTNLAHLPQSLVRPAPTPIVRLEDIASYSNHQPERKGKETNPVQQPSFR